MRNREAVLVGAALVFGCAMVVRPHAPRGADALPCSVSGAQLARAPERSLYEVLERLCPALARAHRGGREIHVYLVRDGEPHAFGNATSLRLLAPHHVARARFIPYPDGERSTGSAVLIELHVPGGGAARPLGR